MVIFSHLKPFLYPSVYKTIYLTSTSQNYLEALELLKQRYGNPQLIMNTYMEQFLRLIKIEKL